MKKFIALICILFVCLSVFALGNQKIYPVDSDVYKSISKLYLLAGQALPSSTGPWSRAELVMMVNNLNSIEDKELFDYVTDSLEINTDINLEDVGFDFGAQARFETYIHKNTKGLTREDLYGNVETAFGDRFSWSYDLSKINPFALISADVYLKDYLSMYSQLSLMSCYNEKENRIGSGIIGTNLPCLGNLASPTEIAGKTFPMDNNFPYRAYIAAGNDNLSVRFGRDRLSWGLGETGNLVISDNMPFHNMGSFDFFTNKFKYTYLLDFFPNKCNFYTATGVSYLTGDATAITGLNMYIGHRFEGRFLSDRLSVTLTEGLMWESTDGHIEPSALIPSYLMHNLYTRGNSNSTIALEADFAVTKGLDTYGQFLIDDLQVGSESKAIPSRIAFLGGLKHAVSMFGGILKSSAECVYVLPYTYLRYGRENAACGSYGLDYVVSNRVYSSGYDLVKHNEYILGYTYGPDCFVIDIDSEFVKLNSYSFGAGFTFRDNGVNDMWTTDNANCQTKANYKYDVSDRNSNCYTFDVQVRGSYNLSERAKLNSQLDYIAIHNIYNVSSNPVQRDVQFVVGIQYTI